MSSLPSEIPKVRIAGYVIEPVDVVERMPVESGPDRVRLMTLATPALVSVQWRLSRAQLQVFDNWFRNTLRQGEQRFTMPLLTGGGVNTEEASFDVFPTYEREGAKWLVSAVLLVEEREMMTVNDLAAIGISL